jgi:hypothetical protein
MLVSRGKVRFFLSIRSRSFSISSLLVASYSPDYIFYIILGAVSLLFVFLEYGQEESMLLGVQVSCSPCFCAWPPLWQMEQAACLCLQVHIQASSPLSIRVGSYPILELFPLLLPVFHDQHEIVKDRIFCSHPELFLASWRQARGIACTHHAADRYLTRSTHLFSSSPRRMDPSDQSHTSWKKGGSFPCGATRARRSEFLNNFPFSFLFPVLADSSLMSYRVLLLLLG